MDKTLSYFNLISHPDRLLYFHLKRCDSISKKILEMKIILPSFFSKKQLEEMREGLAYFHDFGKGTDFFQLKIAKAVKEKGPKEFMMQNMNFIQYIFKKEPQLNNLLYFNPELSNHSEIGAYFFLTHIFYDDFIINLILFRIIKKHHGNLINFMDDSQYLLSEDKLKTISCQLENYTLPLFAKIYKEVDLSKWDKIKEMFQKRRKLNQTFINLQSQQNLKYFFFQHFMYSILLSADKGDVSINKDSFDIINNNRIIPQDVVDSYKRLEFSDKKLKKIDVERELAYKYVVENLKRNIDNKFFSITLPTGMGKTLAAYNAAIKLQNLIAEKKERNSPRIIYCLPFTSIIDQNTLVLKEILFKNNVPLDIILKNHYLSSFNDKYDKKELSDNEAEYLADGWEQEFIITTFVQLLESIFTNRNKSIRKFHNMVNSIIILDEVQNIPAGYMEIIRETFMKMTEYFDTRFILVSATQPILFKKEEILELTDPNMDKTKKFYSERDRIQIDQSLLKSSNFKSTSENELLSIFIDDITKNENKSVLIICNTVAQSQFYFKKIQKAFPDLNTIYLSSSILPIRRKQLIELIKRNINNNKRMILVSTQVVEAGVDIDFDIVYRDFAPLDSINQSAGRCNRNGIKGKGWVKLFHSGKSSRIYDSILLNITERIIKEYDNVIPESLFFKINEKYFNEVWKNISEDNDKSIQLKNWMETLQMEEIQKNFKLINQDYQYYNVFIPYCRQARKIWEKYRECFKIEDFFERKHAIKKIKSELLMYVTRFPKNKYEPNEKVKDDFIIYEENWENYYDLITGFNAQKDDAIFII
jgi:CRISPR-associated endonuclease/helicase Cas3